MSAVLLIGLLFAMGLTEKDGTRFMWLAVAWPYVVGKWWRDEADSWVEEEEK